MQKFSRFSVLRGCSAGVATEERKERKVEVSLLFPVFRDYHQNVVSIFGQFIGLLP